MPSLPSSQRQTPFLPGSYVPSRYRRAQIIEDDEGQAYVNRTLVPHQYRADDLFHIWRDGEYIDLLALKYYGDPRLWWVIADYNELTEMRAVDVGRKLRLPNPHRLTLETLNIST